MKKFISTIFALTLSFGVFAQNETMFIHKDGQIISQYAVADMDSITFGSAGVVINGVRWATRNVDAPGIFAQNPESLGMFYQWNRRTGWAATGNVSGWNSSTPAGTTWTSANDPCPQGWRVPTETELRTLINANFVTSQWATVNGVNGHRFTDRNTGNNIFLPAVGSRYSGHGTLYHAGSIGCYWSSTQFNSSNAYYLYFYSGNARVNYNNRAYGFSVRCVAE